MTFTTPNDLTQIVLKAFFFFKKKNFHSPFSFFSLLQSQMFRMHFAICIASTVLFLICKDSTLRSTRAYYNATGNAITMLLHATLAGSRDPVRD